MNSLGFIFPVLLMALAALTYIGFKAHKRFKVNRRINKFMLAIRGDTITDKIIRYNRKRLGNRRRLRRAA